ncbi:FtsL-like putative cell division protein [Telluribacter humicola]|uniref:FtsL-like putative cell division protein n=1 Tax=Telluribacter humicola TaxID=1720261 RepID=UPI001A9624A7|nr:FtsL-like putative cell division protein [Telluribacter humicola]
MAINKRRIQPKPPRPRRQYQLFNWLNRFLPLDRFFGDKEPGKEERVPVKYFYYLGWLVLLLVVYERIGYLSEQYVRKSIKLRSEVEDLRAEYTSIKAEYMKSGKQSEIIEKMKASGLEENLMPPHKIIVQSPDQKR